MADNTGWFEFITAAKATTHIAYVYEDGSVYLPEGRDVVDQDDFTYAAARGRVYHLVREDELHAARARITELQAERDASTNFRRFANAHEYTAQAAELIAREFLVVPRSDMTELLSVPVGFVVLAKRPDRHEKDAFRYDMAGSIWPTRDPVENHQAYCEDTAAADPERYQGVEYVIAELREVSDR